MTNPAPLLRVDLEPPDLAVSLTGVSFGYNNSRVLEDVTLGIPKGEFVAVLGPNGGGKTTLVKLLLGLLKPDRGEVQILGRAPESVLSVIGYVPQQNRIRPEFPATVQDIVLTGAVSSGRFGWRHSKEEKAKARDVLDRVGMLDRESCRFGDLSGGQKQRVLIARSLVSDPKLLLLDEPTSSIDPQGKFCFFHFLEGLREEMTILVVSHDLGILASRLTAVACVNRRLLHNPEPELTPEMITLLYGTHDAKTCPAGDFFKTGPELLTNIGRGKLP